MTQKDFEEFQELVELFEFEMILDSITGVRGLRRKISKR